MEGKFSKGTGEGRKVRTFDINGCRISTSLHHSPEKYGDIGHLHIFEDGVILFRWSTSLSLSLSFRKHNPKQQ